MSLILALFSWMFTSGIAQIISPQSYLGYKPGADFHLMTYEEAIGYLEKITGESGRIQVMDMGPTPYGRRMKYGVIFSEDNIAPLSPQRILHSFSYGPFYKADLGTRRELANFCFRTIWARLWSSPGAGIQPLHFEWNELFTEFFELGLIKEVEDFEEKSQKKSISRARRDSNSRPAA